MMGIPQVRPVAAGDRTEVVALKRGAFSQPKRGDVSSAESCEEQEGLTVMIP